MRGEIPLPGPLNGSRRIDWSVTARSEEHLAQWTSDGVWNDAAVAGSIGSSHGARQPGPHLTEQLAHAERKGQRPGCP
ncbi:hypothetical protein M2428_000946 [Arthrobacter sp. ES3-54]|jgi:hypothetical protein|nr:hypothetical protein [Arthrobacter sp. ES3-54]